MVDVLRLAPPERVGEQGAERMGDGRDLKEAEGETLDGTVQAAQAEPEHLPDEYRLPKVIRLAAIQKLATWYVGDEVRSMLHDQAYAVRGQHAIALPRGKLGYTRDFVRVLEDESAHDSIETVC